MGAWGAGPFENDDALDWVGDLEETGVGAVSEALDLEAGYIEAPAASAAIAAAEVVAPALGVPAPNLPDEVEQWLKDHAGEITPYMARQAYDDMLAVAGDESELRELWDDSDSTEEWRASMVDLQRRLAGAVEPAAGASVSDDER